MIRGQAPARRRAHSRRGRQVEQERRRRNRRLGIGVAALAVVAVVAAVIVVRVADRGPGSTAGGGSRVAAPAVGVAAPDGTFTTLDGRHRSVADLRGTPTLLWFVTTWCPSCQTGTQVVAQHIDQLRGRGVRVVEVQLYQNLGQSGPGMREFADTFAGRPAKTGSWMFGYASQKLTMAYDPRAYLDIYYLLDKRGVVRYVNGSPSATLSDLLTQTEKLG